jgi:hypothetical protein
MRDRLTVSHQLSLGMGGVPAEAERAVGCQAFPVFAARTEELLLLGLPTRAGLIEERLSVVADESILSRGIDPMGARESVRTT